MKLKQNPLLIPESTIHMTTALQIKAVHRQVLKYLKIKNQVVRLLGKLRHNLLEQRYSLIEFYIKEIDRVSQPAARIGYPKLTGSVGTSAGPPRRDKTGKIIAEEQREVIYHTRRDFVRDIHFRTTPHHNFWGAIDFRPLNMEGIFHNIDGDMRIRLRKEDGPSILEHKIRKLESQNEYHDAVLLRLRLAVKNQIQLARLPHSPRKAVRAPKQAQINYLQKAGQSLHHMQELLKHLNREAAKGDTSKNIRLRHQMGQLIDEFSTITSQTDFNRIRIFDGRFSKKYPRPPMWFISSQASGANERIKQPILSAFALKLIAHPYRKSDRLPEKLRQNLRKALEKVQLAQSKTEVYLKRYKKEPPLRPPEAPSPHG